MGRTTLKARTIAATIIPLLVVISFSAFAGDTDNDGVDDSIDNCAVVHNPDQADIDEDAIGDACDYCDGNGAYDIDQDNLCDGDDNCPYVANPDQGDGDGDGQGDVCRNNIQQYSRSGVFAGSYEEIGNQIAQTYRDIVIKIGSLFTIGISPQKAQEYYNAIEDIIPDSIKEHMRGMAAGLTEGSPLSYDTAWDMVLVNGLFIEMINHARNTSSLRKELPGCTAFAVSSDAGTFLAHNTDNQKGTEGHNAILYIVPDNGDNAYMHFTSPSFVDVMLGMNEKGIAITYNVGNPNTDPVMGLPPMFMVRHVMEKASSLEESVSCFTDFLDSGNTYGYSGAIFLVVDFKDASMAKIQVRSEKIKVTYAEELKPGVTYIAGTNHYDEDFSDDPDYYYESSWKRYDRLMELLPSFDTYDLDTCWAMLTDHGDGEPNNNTISRDGTVSGTTITNIFTDNGSYYTLGAPHAYLEQYTSPLFAGLCEAIACEQEDDTCAATSLLGAGNPGLAILRRFRDNVIAETSAGRKLIAAYYRYGDQIAATLERHPAVKKAARTMVMAAVPVLEIYVQFPAHREGP